MSEFALILYGISISIVMLTGVTSYYLLKLNDKLDHWYEIVKFYQDKVNRLEDQNKSETKDQRQVTVKSYSRAGVGNKRVIVKGYSKTFKEIPYKERKRDQHGRFHPSTGDIKPYIHPNQGKNKKNKDTDNARELMHRLIRKGELPIVDLSINKGKK